MWRRFFNPLHLSPLGDEETGLAGVEYLIQRLDEEIARSHRHGHHLVLIILSLKGLTSLSFADQSRTLTCAAADLRQTMRRNDVIAHLGGGRFALLLTEARPEFAYPKAVRVAAGLGEACNQTLNADLVHVEFGMTVYEESLRDALAMLAQAEVNLQSRYTPEEPDEEPQDEGQPSSEA
ncbi:MAG: diguanylate cyclase domain-containing protein [Dehalococcoidia bacterium]